MSAMFPVSGAFSVFGSRFVSPALGFTLGTVLPPWRLLVLIGGFLGTGWNYWFQWYFLPSR